MPVRATQYDRDTMRSARTEGEVRKTGRECDVSHRRADGGPFSGKMTSAAPAGAVLPRPTRHTLFGAPEIPEADRESMPHAG